MSEIRKNESPVRGRKGERVFSVTIRCVHFLDLQQDFFAGLSSFLGSAFAGAALARHPTSYGDVSHLSMINVFDDREKNAYIVKY
jgi:hypothetical protein